MVLALLISLVWAQPAPTPTPTTGPAALAEEAWQAFRSQQYVTARRVSEALLAEDPDAVEAHLVLGAALHWSEGELPKARFHIEKALDLNKRQTPYVRENWEIEAYGLVQLAEVLGAMALDEAKLDAIAKHDVRYTPHMPEERIWPLLRLNREAEARRWADEAMRVATDKDDKFLRAYVETSLCAIEGRFGTREAYRQACEQALNFVLMSDLDPVVDAHNATLALLGNDEPVLAEETARVGLRSGGRAVSNPHLQLAYLALVQGDAETAANHMGKSRRWQLKQAPSLRGQTDSELLTGAAVLLMHGQQIEVAAALLQRAIERPDFGGYTSAGAESTAAGAAVLRRVVRDVQRERRLEQASSGTIVERWWAWAWEQLPSLEALEDRLSVRRAMADTYLFDMAFVPNRFEALSDIPGWMRVRIADQIGAGATEASLNAALDREAREQPSGLLQGHYAVWQAELAWRRGDMEAVLGLLEPELATLDERWSMLGNHARALVGSAQLARGARARAVMAFDAVLGLDASEVRRMGMRIPVTLEGPEAITARLRHSPRLDVGTSGLRLVSRYTEDGVEICLRRTGGRTHACGAAPTVREAIDQFHVKAFAMDLGIDEERAWSFGGSHVARHEESLEKLQRLLKRDVPEDQAPVAE
ncbi:MAG: hypothetical protein ACON5B_09770 [Myxococcota bacterium]